MGKLRPLQQPALPPAALDLERVQALDIGALRMLWRKTMGSVAPAALTKDLLARAIAHRAQEERSPKLDPQVRRLLESFAKPKAEPIRHLKVGSIIVREYQGKVHEVVVVPGGFHWTGKVYSSLSTIARDITGTSWNGPRFFGLRAKSEAEPTQMDESRKPGSDASPRSRSAVRPRAFVASQGERP